MTEDLIAKVTVVGDIGVGKTCLLLRFTDNRFHEKPVVTIGNDFKQRTVQIGDNRIKLQVWDTAGQERYKSLTSRFFRGSNGILLVFDVTNMKSFLGIENWLTEIKYHDIDSRNCLLVGNKTDLPNGRMVGEAQATSLANRLGISYIETSVKDDVNVQQAFTNLARDIISRMRDTPYTLSHQDESCRIQLPNRETKKPHRSKCPC